MEDAVENDSDDNDEVEDIPRLPRNGAGKKGTPSQKESDRKKRELITIGKAKGFLTSDEVSEHMPEGGASPDQMDDWLSAFSDEGIEIVDSSAKIKVVDKDDTAADDEEDEPEAEPKVEAKEEEDADSNAPTSDPVRTYMRKMGSISLLTREGEVEIAKRIEDGDRRVLQVVLNSSVAVEQILDLGDKLRKQEIRVKEVVKDVDDEDPECDEQWHVERVCKAIDKVRRLWKADAGTNKKKQEILDALLEMRLNKKQIDKIVVLLKEFVERVEQAHREITACEHKSGLSLKEFLKTLREIRSSPMRQRAVSKKLGLRPEEIEEMAQVIAMARKKIKKVEDDAKLTG